MIATVECSRYQNKVFFTFDDSIRNLKVIYRHAVGIILEYVGIAAEFVVKVQMSTLYQISHPRAPKELWVLLNNCHTHDSLVKIEHDSQGSEIGNRLDYVVSWIILVK